VVAIVDVGKHFVKAMSWPSLVMRFCCECFNPCCSCTHHISCHSHHASQEATLLLPSYLAKAEDVSEDYEPLAWWKKLAGQLPRWSSAACKAALVQPSSVAVA